ncbi:MFS transporter [Sphingomonas sp. YL-JM2C]
MTPWAMQDLRRDFAGLLPLCVAYFLASTFILALPMWVGAIIGAHVADERVAGWLATLELGTVALSMLIASRRQAFGSTAVHVAFALFAIGGYALSAFVPSLWLLGVLRVVAGAGFGWLLAATLAAAAGRDNPTKTFGIMEIGLALYACVFYAIVGHAIEAGGMRGCFLAMAACLILCLPAVRALRAGGNEKLPQHARRPVRAADLAGVAAHFLFFVAMYSVWTFLAHKGEIIGVNAQGLGSLLSIAFVAGLVGAALTMLAIPMFGRRIVIPGGLIFLASAMMLLGRVDGPAGFYVAVVLIKAGFLFYTVSMNGHFAASDPTGRLNTIGLAMAMIGSSVGPAIGGYGLTILGFDGLTVIVALAWILVAILAFLATRSLSR